MLMIRLSRAGRKHVSHYHIVVTEKTKPAKSGEIDILGWYDSRSKKYDVDMSKVQTRVSQGAQLSKTVARLFKVNSLTV